MSKQKLEPSPFLIFHFQTNERNYIETKIEVMESLKKMETPANKIFEVLQELDNYYYGEKKED